VGIQSPLVRDAFDASSNQQSEHAMRTMTLPDSDALAFGLLVNWLYTGRIEPAGGCPLRLIEAAKLWTVAGRCQLPTLQNKALTLIFTAFEDPDGEEVLSPEEDDVKEFCRHVYETSDKTPLKRLAVDEMMDIVSTGNVELWLKDLPKGMQGDFTRALVKRLENVPEHTFEDKNAFHYFVPDF
jgi:hypothetical protein